MVSEVEARGAEREVGVELWFIRRSAQPGGGLVQTTGKQQGIGNPGWDDFTKGRFKGSRCHREKKCLFVFILYILCHGLAGRSSSLLFFFR